MALFYLLASWFCWWCGSWSSSSCLSFWFTTSASVCYCVHFSRFFIWCYLSINTCISKKFVVPLHMFRRKYTVTVLDSKWNVIKNRLKLNPIPRKDELLFFDGLYYEVINIVHRIDEKQGIFVVVNSFKHQEKTENQ